MDDLIITERYDTGILTLHKAGCEHAARAIITHPADNFWLPAVDQNCKTCKPCPA